MQRLSDNFYLIPTNKKRNSDTVLREIKNSRESTEKFIEIRDIATRFIEFEDEREYKIEEVFNQSVRDSWRLKKSMSQIMNETLKDQYKLIDKLIPNNWIRLIGAGNGGYFLISSKFKKYEIKNLLITNGIRGIIKAQPAKEGLSNFLI